MKGTDMQSMGDGFSWRRVMEFARFNSLTTRRLTIMYLSVSMLLGILTLLPFPVYIQIGFFTSTGTALPLMFALAPIAFAKKGDNRKVVRMLPVKSSEKLVFYLLYLLVVIPAVVFAIPEAALWLYTCIPAIQHPEMMDLISLHIDNPVVVKIMNIVGGIASCLTCLLVTQYFRSNRVIIGIASVFGVQFIIGLIGAVYGFLYAFNKGYADGVAGREPSLGQQTEISHRIIDMMSASPMFLIITTAIIFIFCCLLVWGNYRTLRYRNL